MFSEKFGFDQSREKGKTFPYNKAIEAFFKKQFGLL